MKKIIALAAMGVAAVGLMLAMPATTEAHGYHHGGYHWHGYRSARYHGGYRTYYYRSGWFGGRRHYYYCPTVYSVLPTYGLSNGLTGQWVAHDTDKAYLGYYVNGVQVAGYNTTTGVYRAYDAATDTWSDPTTPPWTQDANAGL